MENKNFIKFVVEDIKSNLDMIRSIKDGKEGMTFAESAQIFLMDKLGYTQIQAQDVYEELTEGIKSYTAQQESLQADNAATASSIMEATAGYSPEERKAIYVNVLTSMQILRSENADVDALLAKNASLTDEELVKSIIESLDGLPFQYVMDTVKDEIRPESIAMIGETKEMRTEDFKLAVALVLYAAYKEGTASVALAADGTELTPRVIGAMAGAGAAAMSATADLHEGKISLLQWQTVVKFILRALFTVVFAAVCTFAIMSVNLFIASVITSVFGFGFITTLLVIPAMYYFTKHAIKKSEDTYAKIADRMSPVYNKLIAKIAPWVEKVISVVKSWMEAVRQKAAEVSSVLKAPKQKTEENPEIAAASPTPA